METVAPLPCLICKNQLISPKNLFRERTQFSRTLFVTRLSKIVHKKLRACSLRQPEICHTCQSLLNLIDEHESKLLAYENEVRLKYKLPFPIILEPKTADAPPAADEQPTGAPAADDAANDELEAGPDDVIVSADDTGLVTVSYGQADVDGPGDQRPSGATSPAVIWDGQTDQQIIIFNADSAPGVGLLEQLLPLSDAIPVLTDPVAARAPGPKSGSQCGTFFCDLCDASFSSTDGLAGHRAGHDRLRFSCAFCPERCATTVSLSRHLNADHPERLLPCAGCHKRFATKAGLLQHSKQHETRQHACPLCPRRFVTLHDLKLHWTYKHDDSRPFLCPVCRRTFKTASVFRRHKLRHTGLKPHVCPHCDMAFTHKYAMENHASTHLSQRHQCATCGKTFGQRRSAQHHVRLMHSELAFGPRRPDPTVSVSISGPAVT